MVSPVKIENGNRKSNAREKQGQDNEKGCNIPDETNIDNEEVSYYDDKLKKVFVSENGEDKTEILEISVVRKPIVHLKKKLLVLDVNGLLADIVLRPPKDQKPDAKIDGRAIFKRPFYHEFLKFCFQNFEVGVWSSRAKKNVNKVIDYLMGDMKHKLLFCWDLHHCTVTNFKTLENIHKPLVFKDLRRLWEKNDPDLPWEKDYYIESNTLLIDDSPYKALLNPQYTAIFPPSFTYENIDDNSLGAGGDIREYLEGLAKAENMKEYVEQRPFGEEAISERSESWNFYHSVIGSLSSS
ncbi:hypothetical protein L6164_007563 [Bauhinia variegata]|uniref:Uncharacterized protein n=1 Tax=Bauhinia variegata TaxID=167791 RepID=A0ACB9PD83_BAUVA|nr:hypothetical protein L6164_007563 [Bauhinia variegata]